MDFDSSGSSHIFKKNKSATKVIWNGHLNHTDFKINDDDLTIIVLPHNDCQLDYWDNHFHKYARQEVVSYTTSQLSIDKINYKLKVGWGYDKSFDSTIPRWILREFFSTWIVDCINDRYSLIQYNNIPNKLTINAQDIILNFNNTFNIICQALELTKTVSDKIIAQNHQIFLTAQHYLNSQKNCNQWVHDTITQKENSYIPKTIYDEAYIQYLFKTLGYEIKCDGLNNFPLSTLEMAPFIYENR
jgi:hypothetical protein